MPVNELDETLRRAEESLRLSRSEIDNLVSRNETLELEVSDLKSQLERTRRFDPAAYDEHLCGIEGDDRQVMESAVACAIVLEEWFDKARQHVHDVIHAELKRMCRELREGRNVDQELYAVYLTPISQVVAVGSSAPPRTEELQAAVPLLKSMVDIVLSKSLPSPAADWDTLDQLHKDLTAEFIRREKDFWSAADKIDIMLMQHNQKNKAAANEFIRGLARHIQNTSNAKWDLPGINALLAQVKLGPVRQPASQSPSVPTAPTPSAPPKKAASPSASAPRPAAKPIPRLSAPQQRKRPRDEQLPSDQSSHPSPDHYDLVQDGDVRRGTWSSLWWLFGN